MVTGLLAAVILTFGPAFWADPRVAAGLGLLLPALPAMPPELLLVFVLAFTFPFPLLFALVGVLAPVESLPVALPALDPGVFARACCWIVRLSGPFVACARARF